MTHLLTFSGYGTHLHGDPRGSWKNGNPHEPHAAYEQAMRDLMPQPPFFLTAETRPIVLGALVDLAGHRDWHLLAAHVRTSHVHLVLVSNVPADRALVACKAAATKALNHADSDTLRKRWSRGGSTRGLRTPAAVTAAVHYVVDSQGAPMSVYWARGPVAAYCVRG